MKSYGLLCRQPKKAQLLWLTNYSKKRINKKLNSKKIKDLIQEYDRQAKAERIRTIAVAGLCDSSGTTQFSIMTAVFFKEVFKKKIAVIGDGKTYGLMARQLVISRPIHNKNIGSRHAYSINGIDFYSNMQESFLNLLKDKYDIVILDINLNNTEDTFARTVAQMAGCDKKLLIGSMLPWKFRECVKKLERIERFIDIKELSMITLTNGDSSDVNTLAKYGIKTEYMPFERNPFSIGAANLRLLMQIYGI